MSKKVFNESSMAVAHGVWWIGATDPVTGSVAPVHHTPWATAMDDSSKTFLDK